jgi:hypothetical protein
MREKNKQGPKSSGKKYLIYIGILIVGAFLYNTLNNEKQPTVTNPLPVSNKKVERTSYNTQSGSITKLTTLFDSVTLKKEQKIGFDLKKKWLGLVDSIGKLVPDISEVSRISLFLHNNLILGLPSNGIDYLEEKLITDSSRRIIIFTKDNRPKGAAWDTLYNNSMVALYISKMGTLILKEVHPISPFMKGITLIHEGNHAKSNSLTDDFSRAIEEKVTFELQFKIMSQIGGLAYQKVLNKEMQRIRDTLNLPGRKQQRNFPGWIEVTYNKDLDKIFGSALSNYEKDVRTSVVWLQAIFNLLSEKVIEGDVEENKIAFMLEYYIK